MGKETSTPLAADVLRDSSMDAESDLKESGIKKPEDMKLPPETFTVNVSGAKTLWIWHNDPENSLASGGQSVRIDWESSTDDGKTWRAEGADSFEGKYLGKATGHYLSVKSFPLDSWPSGMLYRFHVRQSLPGKFGIDVELEK